MDDDDSARVALVTGAGIRIGRAIATALAGAGWRVWIHHHRSVEPARTLAAELPAGAVLGLVAADLSAAPERARLCATVTGSGGPARGRVDLLVNNAASFERGRFVDRDDDDLARVLETNLVAPLSLVRALAGALHERGGSVINIVDVAGLHPLRGYVDHCVAKAGLEMATRALALELAPVRVNGIAPGTVAWPVDEHHGPGSPARAAVLGQIPLGRIGTPEDIARAALYLADAPFVTGTCLVVDGGRLAAVGGARP